MTIQSDTLSLGRNSRLLIGRDVWRGYDFAVDVRGNKRTLS